jgi:hypothetical protein
MFGSGFSPRLLLSDAITIPLRKRDPGFIDRARIFRQLPLREEIEGLWKDILVMKAEEV